MGRITFSLLFSLLIVFVCACKQTEDFSNQDLTSVESRQPPGFTPFSNNSIRLDGTTGTDPTLAFVARDLMAISVPSYSFSFWFKMDTDTSAIQGAFLTTDSNPEFDISLAWLNGTNQLIFNNSYPNGGPVSVATLTIDVANPQQWNHIVITYSHDSSPIPTENNNKIYLNGQLASEETVPGDEIFWLVTRTIEIFPDGKKLTPCFVDEMAMWLKELSPAEVVTIYNQGVPGSLAETINDFTAWWRLGDNDTLPNLSDEAGNNDMTLIGSPSIGEDIATLPEPDPFAGDNSGDPLNDDESGDGTSGGGGSDPFTGGSGGFGGELGDGGGAGNFP